MSPSSDPFELLRQILGVDLQERELAGAFVSGEVPLTNELVNRFIAAQLAPARGPIAAAHVEARDGDSESARVTFRGPITPTIKILARIDQQPRFPQSAVLGLLWSLPGLGPIGRFAVPALELFRVFPPGIRADSDRITIDIGALLYARGLGDLVRYISKAELHTRQGGFLVQFELRIPSAA